eukprot:Ihof_evm3s102 gene=Ihof_evmTU3s102
MQDDQEPQVEKTMTAEEWKNAANVMYSRQEYYKAVDMYAKAIELSSTEPAYLTNRAAALLMLKKYKEAIDDCTRALALDPTNHRALHRMGKGLMGIGELDNAAKYFEKVSSDSQYSAAASAKLDLDSLQATVRYMNLAKQSMQAQDYLRAIFNIDQVLDKAPGALPIRYLKVEALIGSHKYEESVQEAGNILMDDKHDVEANYLRGMALYYQGNADTAKAFIKNALALDPDHKKARVLFKKMKQIESAKEEGNNAFRQGEFQKAYDLYTKALLVDPLNTDTNAKLYNNRATVLLKLGRTEEAIDDCTESLKLDDKYIKVYQRRAKCYADLGKHEEAVRDYESVSKLEPSNYTFKQHLRDAKRELKKSKRKDYYKILGLPQNFTEDQIKKAYRKEALRWHPDKNADNLKEAEIKFKDVGEAYAVLTDPRKKHAYDTGADLEEGGGAGGFDFGGQGFDVNDLHRMFNMGGGMGGQSFGESPFGGFSHAGSRRGRPAGFA